MLSALPDAVSGATLRYAIRGETFRGEAIRGEIPADLVAVQRGIAARSRL